MILFTFSGKHFIAKFLPIILLVVLVVLTYGFKEHKHVSNETKTENGETTSAISGEVTDKLEWEEDKKFLETLQKLGVQKRITAFQTTLPDPLPGEEFNVALAADILAGTIVQPGETFSMNNKIGPYNTERGFKAGPTYNGTQVSQTIGGGVCKIASTLYNTAILAGIDIIERHSHGMLVPYVPPGQDATVAYGVRDFKFKNSTDSPILIWADTKNNTLFIAFYGLIEAPKVSWHHEILNRQKTYSIYRNNDSLASNIERVVIPGEDGMTVKSWVIFKYTNGKVEKKDLGISYYKPMPRVVERGIKKESWE